ncbi:MAG: hypothetical protein AMS27_17075 [Bacteroides sp. SM23_62_1]|nr:MAG: hypothetical protein AMS27_17075 [Bacteroides sp. SM23_62_1]
MEEYTHDINRQNILISKSTIETYHTLCDLLDKYNKVYYSRFGDGDIFILMGRSQANHEYSEQLAGEIRQSLSIDHPQFLRGLQINYPHEKGMTKGLFERYYYNDEMRDFVIEILNLSSPAIFESGWFPNYYSVFKLVEMNRFLHHYIRSKKKMFIGSVPEIEIQKLFGEIDYYVETPRKNAYTYIDLWWPEILKNVDNVELVLPAAGMATRVIAKRLWDLNKDVHCIDLGSIVDAVSSFPSSRKWIKLKRHVLNRILQPEFRDNSLFYWIKYAIKETGLFFRYLFYKVDPFMNLPIFPKAKRKKPGPFRRL